MWAGRGGGGGGKWGGEGGGVCKEGGGGRGGVKIWYAVDTRAPGQVNYTIDLQL